MTDPTQAATAAWYAVKNDTRSPSPTADPTPYIAAIVALGEGDRRDAERYRWLRDENEFEINVTKRIDADTEQVLWGSDLDEAIDALRGEGDA